MSAISVIYNYAIYPLLKKRFLKFWLNILLKKYRYLQIMKIRVQTSGFRIGSN